MFSLALNDEAKAKMLEAPLSEQTNRGIHKKIVNVNRRCNLFKYTTDGLLSLMHCCVVRVHFNFRLLLKVFHLHFLNVSIELLLQI